MAKGSRGGKSGGRSGFSFGNEGGSGDSPSKYLYPAEFNRQGRFSNVETAVQMFTDKYAAANREYGISIDEQGFVHRHVQGQAHSVSISPAGKNHTIVHNHPSGGAFSGQDMLSFSMTKNIKTLHAVGTKHDYKITKGNRFVFPAVAGVILR